MKNLLLTLFLFLIVSISSFAQGIYKLWGTTQQGGRDGFGTLFGMDGSARAITDKFELLSSAPGAYPANTALVEYRGKFYGMTAYGGVNNEGVLFEWDPSTNEYIKKMDFGGERGANPNGSLALYNMKFYGLCLGTTGSIIFEWDPETNVYSVKQRINAENGWVSNGGGSLVNYKGKFYGVMTSGGLKDMGVIFEWDPSTNLYQRKQNFDAAKGGYPMGSLVLKDDKFYGMTSYGGSKNEGVIFEWDPDDNSYLVKQEFNGVEKGASPKSDLSIRNGKFYGMTNAGGVHNLGVIFEWDPSTNTFIKKLDFDRHNKGESPYGKLVLKNDKFYGMTVGYISSHMGIIFEWDPEENVFERKQEFTYDSKNGGHPKGSLTVFNNKLYGMTTNGGKLGYGVIFEWEPTSNIYDKKHDFGLTDGKYPAGTIVEKNGRIYGVTSGGGSYDKGVIFEWNYKGSTYIKKQDLTLERGVNPTGVMIEKNGEFYGMTEGGANFYGSIFKWNPLTNVYTRMLDFALKDTGSSPNGSLVLHNDKFYGATTSGGKNDYGVLFQWDSRTNSIESRQDLSFLTGKSCFGSLTLLNDKFYGLSNKGGMYDAGTIFEWNIATNEIIAKQNFSGIQMGKNPKGDLTLFNDKFYGMTSEGGINNLGVIFEWDPLTDIFIKKIDFDGLNKGSTPTGSLLYHQNKFYGMTSRGGAKDYGVVFEWDPVSNIFTKTIDFDGTNGREPQYSQLISAPAPTAKGIPGSCLQLPNLTIDATNSNGWVPITDDKGEAIAEIKANGNELGTVAVSLYVHDGPVREDNYRKLFLDRNITITPQFQPATPVEVRFYVRKDEFDALAGAKNSLGNSSGVDAIARVGIYKTAINTCQSTAIQISNPVTTVSGKWSEDYVFSATITSFSTFYFAHFDNTPLPVKLTDFKTSLLEKDGLLTWRTAEEVNVAHFVVERSLDGKLFSPIATVPFNAELDHNSYQYFDRNIAEQLGGTVYYRLKVVDLDGTFAYSSKEAVALPESDGFVFIYPNPTSSKLSVSLKKSGSIVWKITDLNGKLVGDGKSNNRQFDINTRNLGSGIYFLKVISETGVNTLKFVKQ